LVIGLRSPEIPPLSHSPGRPEMMTSPGRKSTQVWRAESDDLSTPSSPPVGAPAMYTPEEDDHRSHQVRKRPRKDDHARCHRRDMSVDPAPRPPRRLPHPPSWRNCRGALWKEEDRFCRTSEGSGSLFRTSGRGRPCLKDEQVAELVNHCRAVTGTERGYEDGHESPQRPVPSHPNGQFIASMLASHQIRARSKEPPRLRRPLYEEILSTMEKSLNATRSPRSATDRHHPCPRPRPRAAGQRKRHRWWGSVHVELPNGIASTPTSAWGRGRRRLWGDACRGWRGV